MEENNLKDVFNYISENNLWSSAESISGTGSEKNNTSSLIAKLNLLFNLLNIDSIIDLGCGDFNWFKDIKIDKPYYGFDLSEKAIEKCQENKTDNRTFIYKDIINDDTLFQGVRNYNNTMIISRDVLVHLNNDDILKLLRKVAKSNARYFVTTMFPHVGVNADIKSGMWRPLNLTRYPFKLPDPIMIINEDYKGEFVKEYAYDFDALRLNTNGHNVLNALHSNNKSVQYLDKGLGLWKIETLKEFFNA